MAGSRNDPPRDVPEALTAREPFAFRVEWKPIIDDPGADIRAAISRRSVVVRDVPIVGLPDRKEREP